MKEKKIKFYLFPAKRYLGKVTHTVTLHKLTIGSRLLKDEELFIATLIHEFIHIDFENMCHAGVLTPEEASFADLAHDGLWTGGYCSLAVDNLHWRPGRKKRRMKS